MLKTRTYVVKSFIYLPLSWRRPLSYRNQSIDLLGKSMDWFLYDNALRHERVNHQILEFAHFAVQKIQISGQYLKLDEMYASANTYSCSRFRNFLIRKKALALFFLWHGVIFFVTFCIWRLKLIVMSGVIPSSSGVSGDFMVFFKRHVFFNSLVLWKKSKLKLWWISHHFVIFKPLCLCLSLVLAYWRWYLNLFNKNDM